MLTSESPKEETSSFLLDEAALRTNETNEYSFKKMGRNTPRVLKKVLTRIVAIIIVSFQSVYLTLTLAHYEGQLWLLWFLVDGVVLACFLYNLIKSYKWFEELYGYEPRKYTLDHSFDNDDEEEEDFEKTSDYSPRTSHQNISKFTRKRQKVFKKVPRKFLRTIPKAHITWIIYSFCMIVRLAIMFHYFAMEMHVEGLWGTNGLKTVIGLTAIVYYLLIAGQNVCPSNTYQMYYLKFIEISVVVEILDAIQHLSLLFREENVGMHPTEAEQLAILISSLAPLFLQPCLS